MDAEFGLVGGLIADVLDRLAAGGDDNDTAEGAARASVAELCRRFPIYPNQVTASKREERDHAVSVLR